LLLSAALLASFVITGCVSGKTTPTIRPSPATIEEIAFATTVPISEMNTRVTLRLAPEFTESTTPGSTLSLWAENQSEEWIIFPADAGLRVYSYSQQSAEWTRVGDRGHYVTTIEPLLAPQGIYNPDTGDDWQLLVTTTPAVADTGAAVVVRVVVAGNVYRNGQIGQPVAAYTDITLQP
jgi:hypothetical protein